VPGQGTRTGAIPAASATGLGALIQQAFGTLTLADVLIVNANLTRALPAP
jgi:hypothetical protein